MKDNGTTQLGDLIRREELQQFYYKPTRYAWVDLGGVIFGVFILATALNRYNKEENWTDAVLVLMGTYMAYVHAQRFLFEPMQASPRDKGELAKQGV